MSVNIATVHLWVSARAQNVTHSIMRARCTRGTRSDGATAINACTSFRVVGLIVFSRKSNRPQQIVPHAQHSSDDREVACGAMPHVVTAERNRYVMKSLLCEEYGARFQMGSIGDVRASANDMLCD